MLHLHLGRLSTVFHFAKQAMWRMDLFSLYDTSSIQTVQLAYLHM